MRFAVSVLVGAVLCLMLFYLVGELGFFIFLIAAPLLVPGLGGLIYFLTTTGEVSFAGDQPRPESTRNGRTIAVMLGLFLGTLLGLAYVVWAIIRMF